MLQILLMILKILGILLLVIFGIVLAVLFVVLFVPLRYRGDVSFDGKPQGGVMVSWLLHLVTVRVNYDSSVKALVKVLWFRLFDKTVWPAEEVVDELNEAVEQSVEMAGEMSDMVQEVTTSTKDNEPEPEPEDKRAAVSKEEAVLEKEAVSKEEASLKKEAVSQKESAPEKKTVLKTESIVKNEAVPGKENTSKAEAKEDAQTEESAQKEQNAESQTETLEEKLYRMIQMVMEKISAVCMKISGKADAVQEKANGIRAKIDQGCAFLGDADNKNMLRLIWNQVLKLLRHILPRKINGRVRFGFDDPSTTGQVLMYISPFYGVYAQTVEIEPVFDEKVMEGELHLKGHIRVASLLWIVIRVFLDKDFRKLLKILMAKGKK